jgi:AraC-like DNA-binding protein
MQAARELLDSGAADSWTLADIALELGLHENTLQRRFREAHGCTVFDYLRRRRLDRARTALREGATVTDAALAAGYGNPANFATAFKRLFGLSPSSVRSALSHG